MELLGNIASNDTSNIRLLPSASKDVFIKFAEQCLHILKIKDRLNGLKSSAKIQNREQLFKY